MLRVRDLIVLPLLAFCSLSFAACSSASSDSDNTDGVEATSDELGTGLMCNARIPCPQPAQPCRLDPATRIVTCVEIECVNGMCVRKITEQCAGLLGGRCSADKICVLDANCAGMPDCAGTCQPRPLQECGGIMPRPCPAGSQCTDIPNDGCGDEPKSSDADCAGYCKPVSCGGLIPPVCPQGSHCADDPTDNCTFGVGDCSGICVSDRDEDGSTM